jgi:glutaredoxin
MTANASTATNQPIVFYSKSTCPWARAVRHLLDAHQLKYDERAIDLNPAFREELRRKTGKEDQPTLKIGSEWLVDTDAKVVARHLGLPEPAEVRLQA